MNSLFTRVCPALIIALALSACGSSGQTPSTSPTPTVPENGSKPAENKPAEPSGNTTADNKPAEPSDNTTADNKPAEPSDNTTADNKPAEPSDNTTADNKPAEPSDNTTADNKPAEPPQNTSSENKENTTAENKPQPNDKPITPPVVIPLPLPPNQQKTPAKKSAALPSNTMNHAPMKFLPIEITMAPVLEKSARAIIYTPWLSMAKKSNYFLTAQCLAEK